MKTGLRSEFLQEAVRETRLAVVETGRQPLQTLWVENVVGIQHEHIFASGETERSVASRGEAPVRFMAHKHKTSEPFTIRIQPFPDDIDAIVARTIVDDD